MFANRARTFTLGRGQGPRRKPRGQFEKPLRAARQRARGLRRSRGADARLFEIALRRANASINPKGGDRAARVLKGRPVGGRAEAVAPNRRQVQADTFRWAAARRRSNLQTGRCVFAAVPFGGRPKGAAASGRRAKTFSK